MTQVDTNAYDSIPPELKALPNWCIAGPDKAPYYVRPGEVAHASLHKPEQWKTFAEILVDRERTDAPGIGFMLTPAAGLTCVDFDYTDEASQIKKGQKVDPALWTTQEDLDRYNKIITVFNSYTEVSGGGMGAHMWLFGFVGLGAKRDGIEVYSQERFIICTGRAFINEPIKANDEMLDLLISEVRGPNHSEGRAELLEIDAVEDDAVVWERAATAGNAAKFDQLVRGEWRDMYKSQSEADLALMSMFTFYSKSNAQCRRFFRATALGQREKATKNDRYLNLTLELVRSRQAREAIIDQQGEELARALVRQLQTSTFADVAAGHVATVHAEPPPESPGLDWPPGTCGALAYFIYRSSPRPVKEIAILAAMGFMAGVTGKAYNIYNSGLNMYLILVARSGVGKEALHTGISLVCERLRETAPQAQAFVDFTEYASGPALKKSLANQNSFVNVSGEWGKRLKRFALDDRPDGPMASLRTEMTNLYQKSGRGNLVGGLGYSNKEQNIGTISGVAYSMVGETTPETFYQSLTQSMMEDGFLSRFIIVEYDGDRPPLSYDKLLEMPKELAQAISGLCSQAIANNTKNICQDVVPDVEADALLTAFDKECDVRINSTKNESVRQMWNRAHLKVLRVSAALAVFDNWHEPIIRKVHAEWALALIRKDIKMMNAKITAGDIGSGDDYTRMQKSVELVRQYYTMDKVPAAYAVPDNMRESGVIPHRYLQQRTSQLAQFRGSRQGAKKSLEDCLRVMLDNGYIQEVPKEALMQNYKYGGRAYRVLSLPPETSDH